MNFTNHAFGAICLEFERQLHEEAKLPVRKAVVHEPEQIFFRELDENAAGEAAERHFPGSEFEQVVLVETKVRAFSFFVAQDLLTPPS